MINRVVTKQLHFRFKGLCYFYLKYQFLEETGILTKLH